LQRRQFVGPPNRGARRGGGVWKAPPEARRIKQERQNHQHGAWHVKRLRKRFTDIAEFHVVGAGKLQIRGQNGKLVFLW
jgi:hypothetical protein